jgi:hypothetical protein
MTAPTTVHMIYQRGDASAGEISAVVREILSDREHATSDLAKRAADAGIDPALLAGVSVEVSEDGQGLEPILTSIVIGLTVRAAEAIAENIWTKVIWPLVRRRLGATALLGNPKTNPRNAAPPDPENAAAAGEDG